MIASKISCSSVEKISAMIFTISRMMPHILSVADALFNGTLYHGYHQLDLALLVLFYPGHNGRCFISILVIPGHELLVAHAVVVLFTLLPENGEVEDELALAISNVKEERFEAKDCLVLQVRIHPADIFNTPSRLGKIGVVHHQTNSLLLVVTSHANLVPSLSVYIRIKVPLISI